MGTVSRRRNKIVSTWEKSHSDDAALGVERPFPERFWVMLLPVIVKGIGTCHEAFGLEPGYLGQRAFGSERSGRERGAGATEEAFPDGGVMGELVVEPANLWLAFRDQQVTVGIGLRTLRMRIMSKTSKEENITSTSRSFGSLSRQSFLMDPPTNLEATLKSPGRRHIFE